MTDGDREAVVSLDRGIGNWPVSPARFASTAQTEEKHEAERGMLRPRDQLRG